MDPQKDIKDKKDITIHIKSYSESQNGYILPACILIIVIIGGLAEYQGDSTLASAQFRSITRIILYICVIVALFMILLKRRIYIELALIPVVWWFCRHVNVYVNFKIDLLMVFILEAVLLTPDEIKKKVFDYYKKNLVITCAIGIVCYISYVMNLGIPYKTVNYYSVRFTAYYVDYGLCYLYTVDNLAVRFCGLFNEPGFCGTIVGFVLCIDRLNLRKKENIILFVAGCLTFSFAYTLILLSYLILLSVNKRKPFIILILLYAVYLFVLPSVSLHNTELRYLISRFTISDGAFSGDNRTTAEFSALFNQWLQSDKILFGYGAGYDVGRGTLSFKRELLLYGFMGFFTMYGYLLLCAFRRTKGNLYAVYFAIVFAFCIYQRPMIFTATYMLILFGGIEFIISQESNVRVE